MLIYSKPDGYSLGIESNLNTSASPAASIGSGAVPSLTSNLLPYLVPSTLSTTTWTPFCMLNKQILPPCQYFFHCYSWSFPPWHFHLNSSIPVPQNPFLVTQSGSGPYWLLHGLLIPHVIWILHYSSTILVIKGWCV